MITSRNLKRLQMIEKHQRAIKRLVAEVEASCSLEDTEDEQGWTWGMYVDGQGTVCSASNGASLLEKFKELRDAKDEGHE